MSELAEEGSLHWKFLELLNLVAREMSLGSTTWVESTHAEGPVRAPQVKAPGAKADGLNLILRTDIVVEY